MTDELDRLLRDRIRKVIDEQPARSGDWQDVLRRSKPERLSVRRARARRPILLLAGVTTCAGIGGACAHQSLREPQIPFDRRQCRRRIQPQPETSGGDRPVTVGGHGSEQVTRLGIELRDRKARCVAE